MKENQQLKIHRKETQLQIADRIYHQWDEALTNNHVDIIMTFYNSDATIESPLIPHLFGRENGICTGTNELRQFWDAVAKHKPSGLQYYRKKYFTDGHILIWEYPRATPGREQMDLVEVMELENGLIQNHRVYWGWYGLNIIKHSQYNG